MLDTFVGQESTITGINVWKEQQEVQWKPY